MGKMIRQCCVCGSIMGVTTVTNFEGERVSHGYCNKECTEFEPVQIMFWDKDKGHMNLDQCYRVGSRYYFRLQKLERFLIRTKHELSVVHYNGDHYSEEVIIHTDNSEHLNNAVKEEAKKWDMVVVLM
jgi:hypothetical protein